MPKYGEKSSVELVKEYFKETKLQINQEFRNTDVFEWFKTNHPKFKKRTIHCTLIRLSINAPSRKHYDVPEDGRDDVLYQVNGNTFKLYDKTNNEVLTTPSNDQIIDDNINNTSCFAYEKDLQNFLVKNLSIIEPGLKLFEEDGITGVEYPVDGRFIDILAIDKNDSFVIFELKVSKGYDRVIGQLLRYKNWIKKNLAEENQRVKGIIICKEITEDLLLACNGLDDIELFEYELCFKIKQKK